MPNINHRRYRRYRAGKLGEGRKEVVICSAGIALKGSFFFSFLAGAPREIVYGYDSMKLLKSRAFEISQLRGFIDGAFVK